ncbi:type II toxin-antitoxin system VapC family toxin [Kineosporiaceae bacterium SCSIO 59966]|nr:type II toxin-antitoxin system VapC family toxin [Kineosporiaceae bacterium SCSIO 59966]
MILFDVNVLVLALRADAPQHDRYRRWLEEAVSTPLAFGLAEMVLRSAVRVLTHPRVFQPPTPLDHALDELGRLRARPNCVLVAPGPRHWEIFVDLCRRSGATGNLVPDAYLAALAIESGSEWITTDRDFARFPGLRWRHPFQVES